MTMHIELRVNEWKILIIAVVKQYNQLQCLPDKEIRLQRDLNPGPSRYQCDALAFHR